MMDLIKSLIFSVIFWGLGLVAFYSITTPAPLTVEHVDIKAVVVNKHSI